MENKVLIIIDAQEDFVRGVFGSLEAQQALEIIHSMADYAAKNFVYPTLLTKDTHGDDYLHTQEGKKNPVIHCKRGTDGWKICNEVLMGDAKIYEKNRFGYYNWMQDSLSLMDEIWLCGFQTDVSLMANFQILKAFFPEVPIVVFSNASFGTTPEMHEHALHVLNKCQAEIRTYEIPEEDPENGKNL